MGLFSQKKRILPPPRHIAIIMDGNGRWAKKRGMPRTAGHAAGAEAFRRTANYCRTLGVRYLTVYAFSTENWKRSEEEIQGIMILLRQYLEEAMRDMEKNHVCFRFFGDLSSLSPDLKQLCRDAEERSSRYHDVQVNSAGIPDPELVIRPSCENRISNFLLWQSAYSEYVFMNVLWPDFGPKDLDDAIEEYHKRDRRFGGV